MAFIMCHRLQTVSDTVEGMWDHDKGNEQRALLDLMINSDDENVRSTLEEALMVAKMIHGDELNEKIEEHKARIHADDELKNQSEQMRKHYLEAYSASLKSLLCQFRMSVTNNKFQNMILGFKSKKGLSVTDEKMFDTIMSHMDDFDVKMREI